MRRSICYAIRRRCLIGCFFLATALAACGGTGARPTATPAPTRTDRVSVVEPAGRPSEWGYAPAAIQVAAGTTVVWHNGGVEFHTATSDDPGRPFDVSLAAGADGSFTFARAGTFAYHCGVHPDMRGAVHVCEGPCP